MTIGASLWVASTDVWKIYNPDAKWCNGWHQLKKNIFGGAKENFITPGGKQGPKGQGNRQPPYIVSRSNLAMSTNRGHHTVGTKGV